jgi:hypothetical protein
LGRVGGWRRRSWARAGCSARVARALPAALLAASLLAAAPARADDSRRALGGSDGLVLRPAPEWRRVALRAARVLAARSGVDVSVGAEPPGLLHGVPATHVAIGPRERVGGSRSVTVVLAGREATVFEAELAVALTVEALRAAALDASLPDAPSEAGPRAQVTRWRLVSRPVAEGGTPWQLSGGAVLPVAKPTILLRILAGVSTVRGAPLVGPGVGLGLCVRDSCVVVEGDLPVLPEERANDRYTVAYRFLNIATRLQVRPVRLGPFLPGASLGFVTRVGTASLVAPGGDRRTQTVTNLGVRATVELAVRIDRRFEVFAEGGLDLSLSRARFINRAGDELLLEDRWTPWLIAGARLRPG